MQEIASMKSSSWICIHLGQYAGKSNTDVVNNNMRINQNRLLDLLEVTLGFLLNGYIVDIFFQKHFSLSNGNE